MVGRKSPSIRRHAAPSKSLIIRQEKKLLEPFQRYPVELVLYVKDIQDRDWVVYPVHIKQ
ncbi:MAG TPA: hypothetical protein DGM18_11090 [Cutibacterium acnes]|nr:hypothetical protein [Cutibacterium acnes]